MQLESLLLQLSLPKVGPALSVLLECFFINNLVFLLKILLRLFGSAEGLLAVVWASVEISDDVAQSETRYAMSSGVTRDRQTKTSARFVNLARSTCLLRSRISFGDSHLDHWTLSACAGRAACLDARASTVHMIIRQGINNTIIVTNGLIRENRHVRSIRTFAPNATQWVITHCKMKQSLVSGSVDMYQRQAALLQKLSA